MRAGCWARWLGLALALVWTLGASSARAADRLLAQVQVQGPADQREALLASLRELLARLQVELRPPGDGPALARVLVDLEGPESRVTIADRGGAVVVDRRLPRSSSVAVTLEELAVVVHAAVEELAEQERRPLGRRVVQPPLVSAGSPEPGRSVRIPAVVELGAFLTARAFGSDELAVFGGGLWGGVRLRSETPWAPRLALHAAWSGPFDASTADLTMSLQTVSVRALGGVSLAVLPTFSLDGALGLGLDALVVDVHPVFTPPPNSYERQRVDASPVVVVLVTGRLASSATAALLVGLNLDLDLLPRRYLTVIETTTTTVFATWRLRPGLMVGFTFDLWGAR